MANIRLYRKKIKTAKNIAKITRAMQMVAVSKMKRSQDTARASREYSIGISDFSKALSSKLDPKFHPLLSVVNPESTKDLVIFVASEKGLCGSLLTNITRTLSENYPDFNSETVEFVCVGKKAKTVVNKLGGKILADFEIGLSQPKYDLVPPISKIASEEFLSGNIRQVKVVYTKFVSTMKQEPVAEVILPLRSNVTEEVEVGHADDFSIFEPSAEEITNSLLTIYLETVLYQKLLEAYASEQSARMVAMKNATDNASSLIKNLTVSYNNARQAAITSEIIDIGSAAMVAV